MNSFCKIAIIVTLCQETATAQSSSPTRAINVRYVMENIQTKQFDAHKIMNVELKQGAAFGLTFGEETTIFRFKAKDGVISHGSVAGGGMMGLTAVAHLGSGQLDEYLNCDVTPEYRAGALPPFKPGDVYVGSYFTRDSKVKQRMLIRVTVGPAIDPSSKQPTGVAYRDDALFLPDVVAHFTFDDADDRNGTARSIVTRNAPFRDGCLVLNGRLHTNNENQDGSRAVLRTPSLNNASFTVVIRFKADKFPSEDSTILNYDWLGSFRLERSRNGRPQLSSRSLRQEFMTRKIEPQQWHEIVLAINRPQQLAAASLDGGRPVSIRLPPDQSGRGAGGILEPEPEWSFADGRTHNFHGAIDRLTILQGNLRRSRFDQTMEELGIE